MKDLVLERIDKNSVESIRHLQDYVGQLNQSNSQLKTKVQFFKTLYESESKKKSSFKHIPPRVETGIPHHVLKGKGHAMLVSGKDLER